MSVTKLMDCKTDRPKIKEPLWTQHGDWLVVWSRKKYGPFDRDQDIAFGDGEVHRDPENSR